MDAYLIQHKIQEAWRNLSIMPSGTSAKKTFPPVTVYVNINGELYPITNVSQVDNKIILEITNE